MSMASHRNVGAYLKSTKGINPANAAAGAIEGPAIDRRGYLSCVLHHACGAASGGPSAQTVASKLQDSADGATGWADLAGAAPADLAADDAEAEQDVDLSAARRYVRVVTTVGFTGGTSPAIPVAATVTLGGGDELPA